MACIHLRQLYELCQAHDLRFGGAELVRIVCRECDAEETCPSTLRLNKSADGADRGEGQSAPIEPKVAE